MKWILLENIEIPQDFLQAVQKQYYIRHGSKSKASFVAQILWQRGIRTELELVNFLDFKNYRPASSFEFGKEMNLAVNRLKAAAILKEKVTIWGDFDADGITSTALLWDGLGEFFPQYEQLTYYIPNRLTESHGLNFAGIERLAQQGCRLIVTCDTGSTNIDEIVYAQKLGIDLIVTDHHTLPRERPPVSAIINPRYLPETHPLFHLSGVAVAYKLVEALYETLPDIPQNPLEDLLDLVAIGLIADLVQLKGDCRYLAQVGIDKLHQESKKNISHSRRPGIKKLLELCHKNGDRPMDISFGLGPRINAVSRIHGDGSFCVELLTSRDIKRCCQLAQETELANSRRKSLQKDVQEQARKKLGELDLSTTHVIVLVDSQWPGGVLGLVAGQIAQETGKPTILLSTDSLGTEKGESLDTKTNLARGSARSINSIDLYQLVQKQAHLLHRFGGHPFAAGLSLSVENIGLFTDAINQQFRLSVGGIDLTPTVQADIVVTVADLGRELFLELKLLEPCGMGNPVPKLLIKNCWFENISHHNLQDSQGKKIQYLKTKFVMRDDSSQKGFPGIWWGHDKNDLPQGRCDCIVEIDLNNIKAQPEYEIRLIDVRPTGDLGIHLEVKSHRSAMIIDWRNQQAENCHDSILTIKHCPTSWDEVKGWLKTAISHQKHLALAWSQPNYHTPEEIWLNLVGIAKFLSRTNQKTTRLKVLQKLGINDQSLDLGLESLKSLGFRVHAEGEFLKITCQNPVTSSMDYEVGLPGPNYGNIKTKIDCFCAAIREEQFQKNYFTTVPLSIIQSILLVSTS
ncbi:single-stranded-DNA-specific exonuclease RecJ [Cylindrospermopsis curvispora]|uniref:Single-stranded-DNA-specific exonuclease RecJ n=1 Tax=Cylindrospermopsis curvispora GIHE-G1 TaxID=2666332 RepID=A0A7H0F4R2_9CYAN|nr:single-stranded-DNA-specific exonuclease RecJ [Cylindrospermopsis curvispora]QNP31028.1 single-stranded-DNA-specific exonuclease RecJ [Cylindrospermopsis curvispora GIHE-G1]